MSDVIMRKKMLPRYLFVINLGIVLIALLSVIPVNLTMRRYGFDYELVPFITSLICCLLPFFLSFPFFNYSRQMMNQFSSRYKFLSQKSFLHIFFVIMIFITLSLVIYFYHQHPSSPYNLRYPYILSLVAIPTSFITTLATLLVIEMLQSSQESVKETTSSIRNVFSWITFVLIILLSVSQYCIYLEFIIVGVCSAVFLTLFIIATINFVKNEKIKKTESNGDVSKPIYSWILTIIYTLVTLAYYVIIILYMVFLVKGYLIINFDEFYSGFFLAIQGSYVLFLIIFYSIIYWIMAKKIPL